MLFMCSLLKPKASQGLASANASTKQLLGRQPLNKTVELNLQLVSAVTVQAMTELLSSQLETDLLRGCQRLEDERLETR
jgi:hypothetical protein